MSRIELHIAWRYLFSKKGHNAINIISGISAGAIMVVTAAMICVMSVMNGFGDVIESMYSEFDPEIRISPKEGKYFRTDTIVIERLRALEEVGNISEVVEENALIRYQDHQVPATVMGVDEQFARISHIENIVIDGQYQLWDGAFDRTVVGVGLANTIGVNAHFVESIHLYAPERIGKINTMRPDKSFREEHAFIAGTFAVNQTQYDDRLMLVSIEQARRLFHYDSLCVTSLMVQLNPKMDAQRCQKAIEEVVGPGFNVQNRQEQQADFYHIMKIEKLLTAVLLVFILLVACFNSICSLTMLIIDKKEDIGILRAMGASNVQIRRIFRWEGWMIQMLGAVLGILLGVGLCLAQQHFGWLKLGSGTEYVLSAYPVSVEWMDVAIVAVVVVLLGLFAAWIPTRKMVGVAVVALSATLIACDPITPRPKPASEMVEGYVGIYGKAYDSIAAHVVDLDLYSEGLGLDSSYHIQGTGTNLYISDLFVAGETLEEGRYKSDTTGERFTFLPGHDYDGTPSGVYLLSINANQIEQIQLIDSGEIVVSDAGEGQTEISARMRYGRYTYTAHYKGTLQYRNRQTE